MVRNAAGLDGLQVKLLMLSATTRIVLGFIPELSFRLAFTLNTTPWPIQL